MAGIYSTTKSGMAAGPAGTSQDRDADDAINHQAAGRGKGLSAWDQPTAHGHKQAHGGAAGSSYPERMKPTGAGMSNAAAACPDAEAVRKAIGAVFSESRTYDIPFSVGADYSPADIAAGKLMTVDLVSAAAAVGVTIAPGMSMIVEKVTVHEVGSDLSALVGAEFVGIGGAVYHSAGNGAGKTYHVSLGSRLIPSQTSRLNPVTIDSQAADSVPPHQLKIWGQFKDKSDMVSDMKINEEEGVAFIHPDKRLYKSLTTPVLNPDGTTMIKPIAAQFGTSAKPHSFKDGSVGMMVQLAAINAAIDALDEGMFQKQAFQNKRTDASKLDISLKLLNTDGATCLSQHNKEDAKSQAREMSRGSDLHIGGTVRITLLQ